MNLSSSGPLAKLDRAALSAVGKVQGFYTFPTVSILVSFWTFLVTLAVAAVAPRFYSSTGMRELLLALPLLTLLLHVCITYFIYRASDEYLRLRILRCAAMAGVILVFSTVGYFCLEQLGYPHLSMIFVCLYGWTIFLILMLWVRHRAR